MSADPAETADGDSARTCAKADPILVADGVRRQFGGLVAVDVEHVEVERNKITALIGPNGAGKTTFFNLLDRVRHPESGHVALRRSRPRWRDRPQGGPHGHGPHVPAHQGARPSQRASRTCASAPRGSAVSRCGQGRSSGCGPSRRTRSPLAPIPCSSASSSITCATSSPATCRAASASCSKWPAR